MAVLTIIRSNEYMNRQRDIKIFSDGKQIGVIKNGATKEFTLSVGSHNIQAKIDWCKSNIISFEISENETKTVLLSGFNNLAKPGGFIILYKCIFASDKYLQLTEILNHTAH